MASRLDLLDLPGGPGRADVPCAVLLPEAETGTPLPLCLLLHGGMSSRDMLVRMREPITTWWEENSLPPLVVATASTGASSCYMDHPDGSTEWETFVGTRLQEELDKRYALSGDAVFPSVSMGGYGAPKIAFARRRPRHSRVWPRWSAQRSSDHQATKRDGIVGEYLKANASVRCTEARAHSW